MKLWNNFYTTAAVLKAAVRQLGVIPDMRRVHMVYARMSLKGGNQLYLT